MPNKYVDGKREGVWTLCYPNGKKYEEGAYVDGKREGVWRRWDENGEVMATMQLPVEIHRNMETQCS